MKYRDLESSLEWMENIASDDTHGYSMSSRYGPNFDCSSFISFALIFGGFNVRYNSVTWDLKDQLLRDGWKVLPKGSALHRGVILLSERGGSASGHVAMMVNDTEMVHASGTNKGILVEKFYTPSFGWDYYLYHPDFYLGAPQTTKKSVEEIAREVIAGKWKNYPERKKLLESAGYNYKEVQTMVNKLLKAKK